MREIVLLDKNTFMKGKYVNIGFVARTQINELKKNNVSSNAKVASFFIGVVLFITSVYQNRGGNRGLAEQHKKAPRVFVEVQSLYNQCL